MCCHVKWGIVVKCPWGEAIDCNERYLVLHFDFLYLGESFGEAKYLLVIKDHATHFVELTVCDSATSTATVEAILSWHSRYGVPPFWVSDNSSHFKNEAISVLKRRLKTPQQFTPVYCPWINGSIARVNRDILQVLRAMILEYQFLPEIGFTSFQWYNESKSHTMASKASVELFTGLPCPPPLHIQYMQRPVTNKRLQQQFLNQKRQRGENVVNFDVGDYVLRSRVDDKQGNMLHVTWTGQIVGETTCSKWTKTIVMEYRR
ncbi:RNA-dependent DNA polymerase [Phytophthora megakarya]|uniref:RNA-dependent DNA polymerase n=1 Tax=Phytophthora megakarya TaxID=4795 RepID=A0A225WPB2_9STRA|nr:RNA-dependent DNA polymerase [Phytophthora megakarya]